MTAKRFLLFSLFSFFAAIVAVLWLASQLDKPLVLDQPLTVEVASGQSVSHVLADLSRKGVLGQNNDYRLRRLSVRLYDLYTGFSRNIHVGEYEVMPGDSLKTLLEKLQKGDVIHRSFTVIEGWNIRELRQALANETGFVQLTTQWDDQRLMEELGRPGIHPEGQFSPDTYFYVKGDSDLMLLQRALQRQEDILAKLWPDRAEDLPYETPYEALIMASIVEKETGVVHERNVIAGVFVKRLKIGMRLQTDPTVIYGMGENYDGNIRRKDLRTPTAYNTYVINGLPPTPIAMPGEDAIYAALHPEDSGALFFVAKGDGSHYFSTTLAEHEEAVRQYQLKRREDYRSSVSVPASGD